MLAEREPDAFEGNPYDSVRHLIGAVRGGPRELSERTGDRFRKAVTDKRNRSG